MTAAEWAELLRACPTLFHMAERGSWDSIRQHGLLSTVALLDLCGVEGKRRDAILRGHRPQPVMLAPGVWVRDQKPMTVAALQRCLTDMMPAAWFELLNGKVFFWLTRQRLLTLLGAAPYRTLEHDVLEVDTAALVAAHRADISLSPINSGATFALGPAPRGSDTFQPIETYDYAARRKNHPPAKCAVELTVAYAVPDVARFVRRVVRMRGAEELATLWPPTPPPGRAAPP